MPRLLTDNQLDFRELTDLFFTHSHPDHIYGFPFLSHCFYSGKKALRCRATPETVAVLKKSLSTFKLLDPDKYLDVEFSELPADRVESFTLEDTLKISSIPTKHSRPGVGYLIESGRQKVLYSGDTAPNKFLFNAGNDADLLLLDCQSTDAYRRYFSGSHCSAMQAGKIASKLRAKVLLPFHFNTSEFPASWQEICGEISEHFDGVIIKPHRGMGISL